MYLVGYILIMYRCESPKKQIMRSDIRSISRKESLEGFTLLERIQSNKGDADENLKESKFQQVKSYFKWKLEKWKDQDLEYTIFLTVSESCIGKLCWFAGFAVRVCQPRL